MKIYHNQNFCKGCWYCVEYCPAKVYAQTKNLSKKGYFVPEIVDPDACTDCGLCDMYCPEFAITLVREEEER
jgi:2-oxoglutarate ferredoxin oxidoreductase subunit delta